MIPRTERARLPRLGIGAAPIGDLYGPVEQGRAVATIRAALERGMALIDTAPYYGVGLSETRVGQALRGIDRRSYLLSSKVGRLIDGGTARFDFSRAGVMRSFQSSLERLGVDYLDIVHIHDPDAHEAQALAEALPALVELRAAGRIGAIGAGMNAWQMLSRFAERPEFDLFLLAGRYTALDQSAIAFLDLCHERRIPIILGGVFNSGILATGEVADAKYDYQTASEAIRVRTARIAAVCRSFSVPLPAVALQFAAAHPAVASLVVGAASPEEVIANHANLHAAVPAELWQRLRDEELLDRRAPTPREPTDDGHGDRP